MRLDDVRQTLRSAARIVRRIVGVPDYDAYLSHVRVAHPGAEPMSREEFEQSRLHDRYSRPGQRCC